MGGSELYSFLFCFVFCGARGMLLSLLVLSAQNPVVGLAWGRDCHLDITSREHTYYEEASMMRVR